MENLKLLLKNMEIIGKRIDKIWTILKTKLKGKILIYLIKNMKNKSRGKNKQYQREIVIVKFLYQEKIVFSNFICRSI